MPDVQRGLWPRRWLPDERFATLACTSASVVSVLGIACRSVACYSAAVFCWPLLNMEQMMSWKRRPFWGENPAHNPGSHNFRRSGPYAADRGCKFCTVGSVVLLSTLIHVSRTIPCRVTVLYEDFQPNHLVYFLDEVLWSGFFEAKSFLKTFQEFIDGWIVTLVDLVEAQHMLVIHRLPDTPPSFLVYVDRMFLLRMRRISGSRSSDRLHTWGPYPLACLLLPWAILHCSSSIITFR